MTCKEWQFYLFSNLDSFYFFSSLIAVTRISRTVVNKSSESSHPCPISDLRGNAFSFSLLSMMFAMSLPYMVLPMLSSFPVCPLFEDVFLVVINGWWILSKAFSALIEMIICFFFFNLLMWHIVSIDLMILKNPCILGIQPISLWCIISLMYCWGRFASVCWGFLHLCSLVIILLCNFLFQWYLCI